MALIYKTLSTLFLYYLICSNAIGMHDINALLSDLKKNSQNIKKMLNVFEEELPEKFKKEFPEQKNCHLVFNYKQGLVFIFRVNKNPFAENKMITHYYENQNTCFSKAPSIKEIKNLFSIKSYHEINLNNIYNFPKQNNRLPDKKDKIILQKVKNEILEQLMKTSIKQKKK